MIPSQVLLKTLKMEVRLSLLGAKDCRVSILTDSIRCQEKLSSSTGYLPRKSLDIKWCKIPYTN